MKKELRRFCFGLSAFLLIAVIAFNSPVASKPKSDLAPAQSTMFAQSPNDPFAAQVAAGLSYFKTRAVEQLPLVEDLLAALQTGNLEAAKQAYIDARPPYEEIEVFAGSFEQEDSDIDARPYAFEEGEESPEFRGFHRVEALIFRDGNLADAVPYTEGLIASVNSLIEKLNDPSNFSSTDNFAGMITLATEVPAKKISSEEETWSDQSLLIFKHNWIGIYSQVEPFLSSLDSSLAAEIKAGYEACMATVAPFFREGEVAATPYSSLNAEQRRAIVEASYRFRDALVKAAAALGVA
jgi:iron uptake system component EfeO